MLVAGLLDSRGTRIVPLLLPVLAGATQDASCYWRLPPIGLSVLPSSQMQTALAQRSSTDARQPLATYCHKTATEKSTNASV